MAPVSRRQTFVRDAVVATLVLAGLYALAGTDVRVLQIPGYLLIVGFDVLEVAFGAAGRADQVLFGAYLVALGVVGAVAAGVLRRRARETPLSAWRLGGAAAFGVVGGLAMLFALAVLVGTDQLEPVAITGLAGVVLLSLAAWLAGALDR